MGNGFDPDWPVLTEYDQEHLARIALPLGGIGTGTVSLGGRGDLRDWEIMNRPDKGFTPPMPGRGGAPFFALYARPLASKGGEGGEAVTRCLEGPLEWFEYEGQFGSTAPNYGLPRFRHCTFQAAYPFGQVLLSDPDLPVQVRIRGFNPFVPGDADASGYPCAVLRYRVDNAGEVPVALSVCGTVPNFIGHGLEMAQTGNHNLFRQGDGLQGIWMSSADVPSGSEFWGTMALATTSQEGITCRTAWRQDRRWGESYLDFWDDLSADGRVNEREGADEPYPVASLCVSLDLAPGASREITFVLAWHYPNRQTWTPSGDGDCACEGGACGDTVGNYYATRFEDAWDAAEDLVRNLDDLEARTLRFARAFCESDLPPAIKEAALYNLSTLRTQTCFRTADGRFYAWEGTCDGHGCCLGSCTHVWNYESATAFLFGDLARSMREVEFAHATDDQGLMSFRVHLPLERAQEFGRAAADGQMGCLLKLYRDWQLSGDDEWLRALWPKAQAALEFCWIEGGWDADRDGVMEGCQHNTMDVEYYGPNPQMGIWYLGALRAAEEMARHLGESAFAEKCRSLFEQGSAWIDAHLFKGEYYEHEIRPTVDASAIAPGLRVGMGAEDLSEPTYQLGSGCLVDQLVGQYMSHVCGLGYLVEPEHVRTALASILKYNWRDSFAGHFNNMRSYVLGDESGLLMADYPHGRPRIPFPYFNEVMTGFEYTAAVGMLQEGMEAEGLRCIEAIRARYDGRKRSPFNEAECGHHYGRAMASWAAVLAWTGFQWSGVTGTVRFAAREGKSFWSNGWAWGTCEQRRTGDGVQVTLKVLHGSLTLGQVELVGIGRLVLDDTVAVSEGESASWYLYAHSRQVYSSDG
jgi:non-lysosomal glucosylceramidase